MSYDSVTPPATPPPVAPAAASSGGGGKTCLIAGLIGCLVVIVLAVVLVVVGGYLAKGFVAGLVEDYTDTEPVALPEVTLSGQSFEELRTRFDAFIDGMEEGTATDPLVLTADEINALIQQHPDWEDLEGKVYVTIEGDEIGGEVSFALDELGFDMFQGRYFNGMATFRISLEHGHLVVLVTSLTLKGEAVPDQFMQQLSRENLAKEMQNDPQFRPTLDALESINIEDGKLILTPKTADE